MIRQSMSLVGSPAQRGFTLIEMLIALLIFGMLAIAGMGLLDFGIRTQAATAQRLDALTNLQRFHALLTADLIQAGPRPTRDQAGARVAGFVGEGGGQGMVAIGVVRGGWDNPADEGRASLQRVEYRLRGDRLERTRWPMLDGAQPLAPATLMSGIRHLEIRYWSKGAWRERWDARSLFAMPEAIEITVDTAQTGNMRQLFLVGTGDLR